MFTAAVGAARAGRALRRARRGLRRPRRSSTRSSCRTRSDAARRPLGARPRPRPGRPRGVPSATSPQLFFGELEVVPAPRGAHPARAQREGAPLHLARDGLGARGPRDATRPRRTHAADGARPRRAPAAHPAARRGGVGGSWTGRPRCTATWSSRVAAAFTGNKAYRYAPAIRARLALPARGPRGRSAGARAGPARPRARHGPVLPGAPGRRRACARPRSRARGPRRPARRSRQADVTAVPQRPALVGVPGRGRSWRCARAGPRARRCRSSRRGTRSRRRTRRASSCARPWAGCRACAVRTSGARPRTARPSRRRRGATRRTPRSSASSGACSTCSAGDLADAQLDAYVDRLRRFRPRRDAGLPSRRPTAWRAAC